MDYSSNCIKLRELCIPLYTNYLIKHKKFPVTRFTPRKKGSGIVYYLRLSRVLSGDTSKNSMAGDLGISIYNIDNIADRVLSGNTPSYNTNTNIINITTSSVLSSDTARAIITNNIDIDNIIVAEVLSGANPKYIKTNKTIKPNALDSESERELFKIGYTSRTITHRLTTMEIPANIKVTVIATLKFRSVTDAYNMEQILHKEFKYGRYYGKVLGNGNSELYKEDVLGLVYS